MRRKTLQVPVGDIFIGSDYPIVIQSMTNTATDNINDTVDQCIKLFNSKAQLVRITAQNIKEAEALKYIKQNLLNKGYTHPIAADIHFNPKLALLAAQYVDKIRINPGNFVNLFPNNISYTSEQYNLELNAIKQEIEKLLPVLIKNNVAVRIGVNKGSLSPRLIDKYGNNIEAAIESAIESALIFNKLNFNNLVISIKTSSVYETISANRLLIKKLDKIGLNYPIHIGVTEAGIDKQGIIKSTIAIGNLLLDGIGNTIRVSLTGDPLKEIPAAENIINTYQKFLPFPVLPIYDYSLNYCPKIFNDNNLDDGLPPNDFDFLEINNKDAFGLISKELKNKKYINLKIKSSDFNLYELCIILGRGWIDGWLRDLYLVDDNLSKDTLNDIREILQATGKRKILTEVISCPSCGRTMYDIEKITKEVKERFSRYPGLTLAVMGCIVNGPGEMKEAQAGIVGNGLNKANIYIYGKLIAKNIPIDIVVDEFEKQLKNHNLI
jgi:(E)-4-hydroxy-3-methylbut-2-enyl-diphosphate synthase